MKTPLALTLALILANPAFGQKVAPKLRNIYVDNGNMVMGWEHPDCHLFQVIEASNRKTNVWEVYFHVNRLNNVQTNYWLKPSDTINGFTNRYFIRAIYDAPEILQRLPEGRTNISDLSNSIEVVWPKSAITQPPPPPMSVDVPPSPLDARMIRTEGTPPEETLFFLPGDPPWNYIAWNYTGEITPNHRARVYQSLNLKSWSVLANQPIDRTNICVVPIQKNSFYKVSVVKLDEVGNVVEETWNQITNLVSTP